MTETTHSSIHAAAFPGIASRRRRILTPKLLLIAPTLILLAAFFIIPYVNMVVMSFRNPSTTGVFAPGYTFANYAKALGDTYYLSLLGQTLWLGVLISAICLVVGYPVAYHLARTRSRYKGLLYVGVLAPLLVGVVIRCYGWTILLANNGLINQSVQAMGLGHGLKLMYNSLGVSIGLIHVFLPFMILPLLSTIQSIDPRLEEAARSLGASRMRAFFRVTFPLSLPGIQSGMVLVFMLTISAYVIPVLLGAMRFKIMPTIVIQLLIDAFLWPFGATLALILSVSGAICVLFFVRLTGRFMRGVT